MRPPATYDVTESNLDTALRYETVIGLLADRWRPDLQILEVGAGSGGITEFLEHPVTGVDIAFERTAERERPLLQRVQASADALPFEADSYDVVLSLEMLEHIEPGRRAACLSEMLRVLRPGGRLVVSFPADATAAELDAWLNRRFRTAAKRDHPWAIEHIEQGVPQTPEMVALLRGLLGEGEVRVIRHMPARCFRVIHELYTIRRLWPLTKATGLHTRPVVGLVFAWARRARGEPAYRSILVADAPRDGRGTAANTSAGIARSVSSTAR